MSAPTITGTPTVYHDVEIVQSGGHAAEYGEINRERVTLRVRTEWRGQPAHIDIEADRYRHSSGMSEWRIVGRNARTTHEEYGDPLSETARTRLAERHAGLATEYLASPAYAESLQRAMYSAIRTMLREAGGHPGLYSPQPSKPARDAIQKARKADTLAYDDARKLLTAADALDVYASLVTS